MPWCGSSDSIENPAEAPVLVPLVKREIVYRLLTGEQGERLRHLAIVSGYTPPIARVIERLHKDFDQPIRKYNIASELGMSVSGFHHHFKAVTAMSPLQFQKRLRLQEARRLMLSDGLDACKCSVPCRLPQRRGFQSGIQEHLRSATNT